MLPIALTAFFILVTVILLFRMWHLQGQAPVYSQIPTLKRARKTLLISTLALAGAGLAQTARLLMEIYKPEPEPPECTALVLDEECEEDLHQCENTLLAGEKAMLTYDNHCQCPWSPLTLETMETSP